ncbi:protein NONRESPONDING TO OXYLIPINS 2, mitochondrial-like [Alnus glutinosa]|uniref:protein NONRESPONDING TO OXYLIPINS 2, mitochondrial-like n=1 Tax=Alnus glutinosa TaxID=3517 RepID=UPI002D791412|nr:protein NONRESPONDING TO OXYLIPINS 2, mitochondrial-like [Alnus glutinosa]
MALRSGSLSRSLLSTVRSTQIRRSSSSSASSSSSLRGLIRPPAPPRTLRRPLFTTPRAMVGEFACVQSLTPMHNALAAARLTSHISVNARAFCELSQGT